MAYVRKRYGVPAKRGGVVRITYGHPRAARYGTILSAGYTLRVRVGDNRLLIHPAWRVEYLADDGSVIWPKEKP